MEKKITLGLDKYIEDKYTVVASLDKKQFVEMMKLIKMKSITLTLMIILSSVLMSAGENEWYTIIETKKLHFAKDGTHVAQNCVNLEPVKIKSKRKYTYIEIDTVRLLNVTPHQKEKILASDTVLRGSLILKSPSIQKYGFDWSIDTFRTKYSSVGYPTILEGYKRLVKVPKDASPSKRIPRTVIGWMVERGYVYGEWSIIYIAKNSTIPEIQKRLTSLGVAYAVVLDSSPFLYLDGKQVYRADTNAKYGSVLTW